MHNKPLKLSLFKKTFEFPEDIIEYIKITEECDQLFQGFYNSIFRKIQNKNNILDNEDFQQDILIVSNFFIKKLCDNNIYSISVDEFISDNIGVKAIEDINKKALDYFKNLLIDEMEDFLTQTSSAEQRANSMVTGSGVRFFTSNMLTLAANAAIEYSILKNQIAKADEQYRNDIATISAKGTTKRAIAEANYLNNEYLPQLNRAISMFVYSCLNKYISILIKNCLFDENTLKFIDIQKSEGILKNLSLTDNKNSVILEAFLVCPFNINIYIELIKLGEITTDIVEITSVLGLKEDLIQYLSERIHSKNIDKNYRYVVLNIHNLIKCYSLFTNKEEITITKELFDSNVKSLIEAYRNIHNYCINENSVESFVENNRVLSHNEIVSLSNRIVKSAIKNDDFDFLKNECGYNDLLSKINFTNSHFNSKQELDKFYIDKIHNNLVLISNKNKNIIKEQQLAEERIRNDKEKRNKKTKKLIVKISIFCTALLLIFSFLFVIINKMYIKPNRIYASAIKSYTEEDYEDALKSFEQIKNFKDSAEKINSCKSFIENEQQSIKKNLFEKYSYLEGNWYSNFVVCNDDYEYSIDSANINFSDNENSAYAELKFRFNFYDFSKKQNEYHEFLFTIDLQNLVIVNTNNTYDGEVLVDIDDNLKITLIGFVDEKYFNSSTDLEIEFYKTTYFSNMAAILDEETVKNIDYIGKKLSETKYDSYDVCMLNSKYFKTVIEYQDNNSRSFLNKSVSSAVLVFNCDQDKMNDCKCCYLELTSIGDYSLNESKVLLEHILDEKAYDIDNSSFKIDVKKQYYTDDKNCCIQVSKEGEKILIIKIFNN